MEWKKIAKVFLRILWMLAPPKGEGLKGLKGSKVQGVRKDVCPNMKEDESGHATLQTPQTP